MTRTGPDRQPPREVFEFPVEMHRTPVVHHDQLVGHGIEQVAVVQDQHDGAKKLLYGNAKCLIYLKIKLVSGLDQLHEIGALVGDQSVHQARLLAPGNGLHGFEHAVAPEPNSRQIVAEFRFGGALGARPAPAPQLV